MFGKTRVEAGTARPEEEEIPFFNLQTDVQQRRPRVKKSFRPDYAEMQLRVQATVEVLAAERQQRRKERRDKIDARVAELKAQRVETINPVVTPVRAEDQVTAAEMRATASAIPAAAMPAMPIIPVTAEEPTAAAAAEPAAEAVVAAEPVAEATEATVAAEPAAEGKSNA